jgi:peptidoglycan/LPS O-acetylase OafA/YrhL
MPVPQTRPEVRGQMSEARGQRPRFRFAARPEPVEWQREPSRVTTRTGRPEGLHDTHGRADLCSPTLRPLAIALDPIKDRVGTATASEAVQTVVVRETASPRVRVQQTRDHVERNLALDGVRGLAIAMVLLYHAFSWSMGTSGWGWFPRLVERVTRPGWLGVDLFFVLSGFLITAILLDSRDDRFYFRNFYARRALRILPLFSLTLLAVFLAYPGAARFVGLSALFLGNLVQFWGVPMIYGPLWSLAVEEHFYLVWPLLVHVGSVRVIGVVAALLILGEPLARLAGFYAGQEVHMSTWFRLDGLASGALLALLSRERASMLRLAALTSWLAGMALLVGGAPFGVLSRQTALGAALQYTPWTLLFVGLVARILVEPHGWLARACSWRGLGRLGDLSYCLYLVHVLLFHQYDRIGKSLGLRPELTIGRFPALVLRATIVLGLSMLIAEISYRSIETPILRLRRHFPRLTDAHRCH